MKHKYSLNSLNYRKIDTPNFIRVDKNLEISDDKMKIETINVGKNLHADGMLVVHLLKQKILYQSDLFEPFKNNPSVSRSPIMRWFVNWLDNSGIKVERLFAIHGSRVVTNEQIQKVRELNQNQK